MDIIYAAEKPSIAKLFSQRMKRLVETVSQASARLDEFLCTQTTGGA